MRKFYTLAICLLTSVCAAFAQEETSTFQFVTADGTVVPDGSTVTVTAAEVKNGKTQLASGLYVKTNANGYLSVGYSISAPNGDIQLCFPINCSNVTGTGETSVAAMAYGNDPQDLQTEWMPTAYGTATVKYTLKTYEYTGMGGPMGLTPQYSFLEDISTVTVKYVYNETSLGINNIATDANVISATYYDMAGRMTKEPGKGLYIKKAKMADGTVKTNKVILK